MNVSSKGGVFSTRNIVIIVCAVLIVFLAAVAVVVAVMGNTGDMLTREQIEARLEELGEEDLGHKYVAAHLTEFGIGGFDAGKFRRIEYYFSDYYAGELPSIAKMAYDTAELFMSYYYDRVDHSDKQAVTTAVLYCYAAATGDRYAVYRTAEELEDFDTDMSGTFVGIGVTVYQTVDPATKKLSEVRVEDVINNSGAKDAGVLPNDLIVAVDGVRITEFDSNSLIKAIRGDEGTTVSLTVSRSGEEITLSCVRSLVVDLTVEYTNVDGVAYIEITSFKSNTPELFAAAISSARADGVSGIVFDLRNNPGGYLDSVLEILDMLVPAGVRLASYTEADGSETVYNSTGAGKALELPSVVLCNGNTASAGELFTSALRDYNAMGLIKATVVGEKTYGKGIMQSTYTLYDGSSITLTTAYYDPPSGVNYNGIGITPDVPVSRADGETEDSQLKKAYEVLLGIVQAPPSNNNTGL